MTLHAVELNTDMESYVDFLFEGQNGFVYSPSRNFALDIKDPNYWNQEFFKWPEERSQLLKHITSNADKLDVYIAPAVFSARDAHQEFVQSSTTYWCEFDGSVPTELGDIPEPTMKVKSSGEGHEHWYWKLDSATTDIETLGQVNRALAFALHADSSGWDCNQVLRPPQTINHKRGLPVSLVGLGTSTLNPELFSTLRRVPVVVHDADFLTIPDALDVVFSYKWPNQAIKLFREKTIPLDRSDGLMSLAYSCAEMGQSNAEIYSIIRNADDRWGKFTGRSDRERRLLDVVNVARNKFPIEIVQQSYEILPVYGFKTLLDTEIEIEWLIPEILSKNGSMMITGPSGVGKTQFSLRCAMNLALGNTFLDWQITEPSKVLFFSLEMGLQDLKYFLSQMAVRLTPSEIVTLEENLLLVPIGESIPLDTTLGQSLIEDLLAKYNPVGFFWDSLGSASNETLDEATAKKLSGWSEKVRKKYDCFAWYIHHQRKGQATNKKPKTQDDVYGSQYIVARQTSIFCLWPVDDDVLEVIPLKTRMARKKDSYEIVRTKDLDFFIKPASGIKIKPQVEMTLNNIFNTEENKGQPEPMMGI